MKIVIQLIQSYLMQDIPSILITTDTNKYLFNVPSSFQRFTRENRIKLPTMSHYFFTKATTSTISGLTGMLLTLYQRGDSCNSRLYFDDKLFKYMQELRYKMGFKVTPISYCSWSGKVRKGINYFQKIIQLSKREDFAQVFNNMEQFINTNIPINQQNDASRFYNLNGQFFQNQEIIITPFQITSNGQNITNFIVIPNRLPGKMLNDKLKAFGVKGTAISELVKNGKITLNGRQILLQQVKQPDSESPSVIILHYNSKQSIDEIIKNQIFKSYLQNPDNFIYCVVHIIENSDIITSPQFKFIISLFPQHVEHLVYNRKYKNSTDQLQSLVNLSAQVQLVSSLNKFFPICMPNLEQKHLQFVKNFIGKTEAIDKLFPQKKVRAYKKCQELIICPKKSWGYKTIPFDSKKEKKLQNSQVPQIMIGQIQLEAQMKQKVKIMDPKIIFLGTGSMKPSKYRNVSSILVEFGQPKMLLDCGEGSHIQIAQHYGYEQYQEVLLDIRTIFITHIHSDHNLGILDLISQRNAILEKRGLNKAQHTLYLILPANVVPWFESFCLNIQNLKEGCEVVFIQTLRSQSFTFEGTMSKEKSIIRSCSSNSEMKNQSSQDEEADEQLNFIKPQWQDVLRQYGKTQQQSLEKFLGYLKSIGIVQFLPSPVIHCPQSHGIIIKHFSDIKISYSGDTRPCESFAEDAVNSTIMIHEATFGDDLAGNASSHFHSTVGEAIDIGMRSKSWKTALTHFSQRYKSASQIVEPKMYKANKAKQQYAEKHTIVCFDHLEVNVSKAHVLPYYSRGVANSIPKDNKE